MLSYVIFHLNINLPIGIVTCLFGTTRMLEHGIWFNSEWWLKYDILLEKYETFGILGTEKKIHYIETCFTWTDSSYFSIEH